MEFNVGIGGRVPGEPALCGIGTSSFDSVEAFQDSLRLMRKIAADIPITVMWLENFKLVILFNN
jgi:nicotinamide riboside transporter PnuC